MLLRSSVTQKMQILWKRGSNYYFTDMCMSVLTHLKLLLDLL